MLTVRLIAPHEVAHVKHEWNALVGAMAFPSFFCSWEWVATWFEHYAALYEPVILGVYEGASLLGIMPLTVRKVFFENGWKTGRILEFNGQNVASDHVDLICTPADAERCAEAIVSFLHRDYPEWDLLVLSHLSAQANLRGWLGHEWPLGHDGPSAVTVAPFLPLMDSFKGYSTRVLAGRGKTIRYQQRRLEKMGLTYRPAAVGAESEALYVLFSLHEKRALAKGITSTLAVGDVQAFHRDLVQRLGSNGSQFFRFIGDGERHVAAFYGFLFKNRLLYYQIGHDPTHDQFSPGAVLLYHVIEEAYQRGVEEVDFLRGAESYKNLWTDKRRDLLELTIYNSTPKSALSKAARGARRLVKRFVL